MKIKVTTKAGTVKPYGEYDDIPDGIYIDRDGDLVIYSEGSTACFSTDGEYLGNCPEWPILPAPAGTKIEISN